MGVCYENGKRDTNTHKNSFTSSSSRGKSYSSSFSENTKKIINST